MTTPKFESDFAEYYQKFKDIPTLSPGEERDLLGRAKAGDREAYDQFVRSNIRLVMYEVLQFVKHTDPRAMDLVSDGTIGLIKAIQRFNLETPYRFSTYAVWWIKCHIRRSLKGFKKERSTVIKSLSKDYETAKKILRLATGQDPTDEAIASYLKWDAYTLRTYLKFTDDRALIGHLNEPAANIPAPVSKPEEEAHMTIVTASLNKALGRLRPEEEDIIRRYHGLGCKRLTYEEIGRYYNMTKEWVRQREGKALRKLFLIMKENQVLFEFFKRIIERQNELEEIERLEQESVSNFSPNLESLSDQEKMDHQADHPDGPRRE